MKVLFPGYVQDGKLELGNRKRFTEHLYTLSGPVHLSVWEKENSVPVPLNNYYWGCLVDTVYRLTGQNPHEIHETWKYMWLIPQKIEVKSGEIVILNSTTVLSIRQFWDYKYEIQSFYAKWGIQLPDPNEVIS